MIEGFCRADAFGGFDVGALDPDSDYHGPVADVSLKDGWLTICTDPYEGNVGLNKEALPFLIEALQALAARGK